MASFDFDALKDRAGDLVQSGISKSKEILEITKLKMANMGEEDTIRKAYIEIGKLYYAERGMSPEAAYVALCNKITAAKVNIEENKKRIDKIKTEGDITDDDIPDTVLAQDAELVVPAETVVPSEEEKLQE